MKKEEKYLSPSSSGRRRRRENSPDRKLQAKSIGCMSAILRLVYRNNNGRRSLTSGKKQEKIVKSSNQQSSSLKQDYINNINNEMIIKRLSCDVPRSPTLPADIRRSNTTTPSSPAIVERLMGLEEKNNINNNVYINVVAEESTAEKRRKLLGALEKCDEDLKALKKIIELVNKTSGCDYGDSGGGGDGDGEGEIRRQQPNKINSSGVVFDELGRSALSGYSKRCNIYGRALQTKKPGKEEEDGKVANICFGTVSIQAKKADNSTPPSSTAMVETVNKVCKDIAWGKQRELGRIVLALQDYICRELIEEIVKEMECCYYKNTPLVVLPFEACKRRLNFQ